MTKHCEYRFSKCSSTKIAKVKISVNVRSQTGASELHSAVDDVTIWQVLVTVPTRLNPGLQE